MIDFAKSVYKGLWDAVRTDIDVFLIATAGLLWPFKFFKGLSVGTLFYVACRRLDGLMGAYLNIKNKEIDQNG